MPNPRGSFGYGQKFTDDINQDWGGKPYDDIMAVTDYVAKLPYVDADRMAAAGGSYGGYMIDWMLGHTSRFKCFVTHAGVYDLRSEAEATEELWFPMWEFGGMPWDNPEVYDKWSPSKFTQEFRTPTLVIHGELDFRIPYSQGLQLFTALQLHKVPSELLVFPDEGHWVLKPQNSAFWYKTFLEWVELWIQRIETHNRRRQFLSCWRLPVPLTLVVLFERDGVPGGSRREGDRRADARAYSRGEFAWRAHADRFGSSRMASLMTRGLRRRRRSSSVSRAPRPSTGRDGGYRKSRSAPNLHDGKARLVVTAVSNDFRGKTNTQSFDVDG